VGVHRIKLSPGHNFSPPYKVQMKTISEVIKTVLMKLFAELLGSCGKYYLYFDISPANFFVLNCPPTILC
jgi:hypothetical protein